MMFTLAQLYLSNVVSGQNQALASLQEQVDELAKTLALKRSESRELRRQLEQLRGRLEATITERDQLRAQLRGSREQLAMTEQQVESLREEIEGLEEELSVSKETLEVKLRELASLQEDIDALRKVKDDLEQRVGELAAALEEQEAATAQARDRSKALQAQLAEAEETTQLKQETIEEKDIRIQELLAQIEERDEALAKREELTAEQRSQIATLRQEIQALRDQLAALSEALEISKETVAEQQETIEDLGERLNLALVEKVRELNRYRSEFFGRLREILGDREDIRIVGDRFMFQSELFFATASAEIGPNGKDKLQSVARTLKDVMAEMPGDLPWVLMVEGHTDRRPIDTDEFPSNWELSTARANSIVHFLVEQGGIPPDRLAAAGYAEHQPLVDENTAEAYARNRRIELKFTSR
ncbi:peptidoglycan -binding protein [Ectothiorhodospiraceae bacterium WFHF3C12]|nr:peptidoglycan -binding protein [Ectothiorhodospiraceae bacterium WFHF3C12]